MARLKNRDMAKGLVELQGRLGGLGEVLAPEHAEEPILAKTVRDAVFGSLRELGAADDLEAVGIKPRSSALLSGPPGCGKTTLAHHLAARLGIPMVTVGAEHLISKGLGDSERNVARLFNAISEAKCRCVLFLDEIDAIGGARRSTAGDTGGAVGAMNSTLTVLLRQIEAFDGLLIAATNLAETLDSALWRRFGMQITIGMPDDDARWAILKRYGEPFQFADETIDILSDATRGAPPSLLRQLMEGVKRDLVLRPRVADKMPTGSAMFQLVAAQVRPHPEYEPPPLWSGKHKNLLEGLDDHPWPPTRPEKAAAEKEPA